jgi:predicted adenine nucleotide alpha hydrolase (AANH) superfamily ATPase
MKVLLHICCAVCAASCVERLRKEGHEVSGFFYNPNIQPPGEYLKRLQEIEELARKENFPLIVGDYDIHNWSVRIEGLEDESEGGRRCTECFTLRLENAAHMAQEKGFQAFTTTLTVSPHKDSQRINKIGKDISNGLFLLQDFKKKDGFKRTQELAKKYSLYRQNYCGCIYSLNKRQENGRLHKKTRASRD